MANNKKNSAVLGVRYGYNSRYNNWPSMYSEDIKGYHLTRWDPPDGIPDKNLLKYEVSAGEKDRPDLISYEMYGDPSLWWIICLLNDIKNPFRIDTGSVLKVPKKEDISVYLSERTNPNVQNGKSLEKIDYKEA